MQNKLVAIFDKYSRQIEYAIIIEVLNQISPLLEEASLHLEIYNPEIILQEHTFCHLFNDQINEFQKLLKESFYLPFGHEIVTLNRTSQNEAFNLVKLVYLDKKIDYWQLYFAYYAIAILHYNEGYTYLLSELSEIYSRKPFETKDL
ncbi:hypothetical protein C2G38_2153626 [Gigaspora rosea]|uniref:Uncharacterized protein n=1 Tax=Gigaspora rosea TaxID=44941 RepID=A0A397W5W3_9GLOM|nr:hypothetical protein C2G38_2153626 [Gigaspora rosea]